MTLGTLIQKKQESIIQRWLDDVLATYPEDGAAAFGRQRDRFANPVGHSLRAGTRGIVESLLDEVDREKVGHYLGEIIRIRAVQEFSASRAVGFVFGLKSAIRAELGAAVTDPDIAPALAELEGKIDRIALTAFDIFVQCREQVCDLRVNEMKRRFSWVVDRMNGRDAEAEPAGAGSA